MSAPAAARSPSRCWAGCRRCEGAGGEGRSPTVLGADWTHMAGSAEATQTPWDSHGERDVATRGLPAGNISRPQQQGSLQRQRRQLQLGAWHGVTRSGGQGNQQPLLPRHSLDALGRAGGIRVEQLVSRLQLRRPVAVVRQRACGAGRRGKVGSRWVITDGGGLRTHAPCPQLTAASRRWLQLRAPLLASGFGRSSGAVLPCCAAVKCR